MHRTGTLGVVELFFLHQRTYQPDTPELHEKIATRAYYLSKNGEPGTDDDRWHLAKRIQLNGELYDQIFSAVSAVVLTALPPAATRQINRQTRMPQQTLARATEAGTSVPLYKGQRLLSPLSARTLGEFVDDLVAWHLAS